jgi:hypothetical protein
MQQDADEAGERQRDRGDDRGDDRGVHGQRRP